MIKDKINDLMKEALKAGDKVKLETLRSIRAAIIEFEKVVRVKSLMKMKKLKS